METSSVDSIEIAGKEIFKKLKDILEQVAPEKVLGEITGEKFLAADFGFDSIDIMSTLVEIQERFPIDFSGLNIEELIYKNTSCEERADMTVDYLCGLIQKYMNNESS